MRLAARRVVKIGGRAQRAPGLSGLLADAVRASRGATCVVHGGGDEVSGVQRRLGMEPVFAGGRRVTSEQDLEVVRMVLSGTVNKRLVALFLSHGLEAVGISGEDASLFAAHRIDARMGCVGGRITANPHIVLQLLAGGFTPVISPLARDADDPSGGGLNVNGDDAAAALANALHAEELLFVVDVPGVLDDGALMPSLDLEQAAALISRGTASGGMTAKLEAASAALVGGVTRVRIAGLEGIGDPMAGTRIVLAPSSV